MLVNKWGGYGQDMYNLQDGGPVVTMEPHTIPTKVLFMFHASQDPRQNRDRLINPNANVKSICTNKVSRSLKQQGIL